MKNTNLFWLTVFAIVYFSNSCGARKSDSEKTEKSEKIDYSGFFRNSGNSSEFLNQNLNLKKSYSSNTDDQSEFETDELTVAPIDPSKPAAYTDPSGKKHILENSKMTNKKGNQKNKIVSGNSGNSEKTVKTDLEKKEENKSEIEASVTAAAKEKAVIKNTTRQQWSLWNFLWLLVPVGLFFGGKWAYNKYKKVNLLV